MHYRCVFFDGLNRYYIAAERELLEGAFAAPPNVFDNYISAETHRDIAVEAAVRGVSLAACAGSILEEYFKKPRRAR